MCDIHAIIDNFGTDVGPFIGIIDDALVNTSILNRSARHIGVINVRSFVIGWGI